MGVKDDRREDASGTSPTSSRREAVRLGLATLAGMGISALGPTPALASTGTMEYGKVNNAGSDSTTLTGAGQGRVLSVLSTGTEGTALNCSANSQFEVARFSSGGNGAAILAQRVRADSVGSAVSVIEGSTSQRVSAISARLFSDASTGRAVDGSVKNGAGAVGVQGVVESGTGWGVKAINAGTGGALAAEVTNAANPSAAVTAYTAGTGYAVLAQGANALRVEGKLTMTRSGRARIARGKASVTVTVPTGLSTTASILCTPQGPAGSGVYVLYAKRASATQFKIVLNKACTTSVNVAWMVLG